MVTAPQISFASKELADVSIPHDIGVDPLTGSAAASAGLRLTVGRSGFQPALSLVYGSSAGNSAYGLGWSLSGVPSVELSFKQGLPKYDGTARYAFWRGGAGALVGRG